jgi:hypothetical protein
MKLTNSKPRLKRERISLLNQSKNFKNIQKIRFKKFYFDNVIITAFHATVNHFSFIFSLSGEKTYTTMDYTAFGYSIDEIKNRSIQKLNGRIKGLKWQINNNEVAIDKIKKLS